jgi:REP element-mobilizing transposase RayT
MRGVTDESGRFVTRSVTATMRGVTEPFPLHLFDREAKVNVVERRLPHWAQAGAITFITWRTDDSIPAPILAQWRADRCRWLRSHGIDPNEPTWQTLLATLEPVRQREFRREFSQRWHNELDAGHGACVLHELELAQIVADSLKHFDGDRYVITDFVVMPNHVHLLAAFRDEAAMLAQCESWKHYTAVKINRLLSRKGRFWERDSFDHLVRTQEQFEWIRRYIAENPAKARLRAGQFIHYSKR